MNCRVCTACAIASDGDAVACAHLDCGHVCDTPHPQHHPDCGINTPNGCECPNVCADCCNDDECVASRLALVPSFVLLRLVLDRGALGDPADGGRHVYLCEAGHRSVIFASEYPVCTAEFHRDESVVVCGADVEYRLIPYEATEP